MLVELGWAVWQAGVGHPGPVESSLLYSSKESWIAGFYLLTWLVSRYWQAGAIHEIRPFRAVRNQGLMSESPGCKAGGAH